MAEFSKLNGHDVKDKKAIRFYNTVADMKADANLKAGQQVKTRGYYSIDDGGAGEYIINETSSLTEHQESIDNGLYATLICDTVYNVNQMGIISNNQTNYTSDLSNIIQKIPNGGILYFPAGTYNFNIDSTLILIDKPMTVLGDGKTTIINKGKGNIIDIKLETQDKRFVYIRDLILDENDSNGKCVNILSANTYYLANFSMINVKCLNGEYGFYLDGVTNDNLFISSFERCSFWNNGFYGNKIGDTIRITGCQFAFGGGIYINQVAGASSLEFSNNNVTCTDGFILETNSAPIIMNNIFEMTRVTNNTKGYVEICPNNANRMFEVMIMSNTFSYASGFASANKPLLYIGKTGKCKILANFIGVQDNNYSVHISSDSTMAELNSSFGVYYGSATYAYALKDEGVNTIVRGAFYNGVFYDGVKTANSFEKYTGKKTISGALQIINGNPVFASSSTNTAIRFGTYNDDYNVTNPKDIGYITSNGILPLNLLIGGITNHCRIRYMAYALPSDDLQQGDLFINKYITQTLPYPLYYYDGTSVRGIGELH